MQDETPQPAESQNSPARSQCAAILLALLSTLGVLFGYSSCQLRAIDCYALRGEELAGGTRAGHLTPLYSLLNDQYSEEESILGPAPQTPRDARSLLARHAIALRPFSSSIPAPGAWVWFYRPATESIAQHLTVLCVSTLVAWLSITFCFRQLSEEWSARLRGKRQIEAVSRDRSRTAFRAGKLWFVMSAVGLSPFSGALGWYLLFPRSPHGLALPDAVFPSPVISAAIICLSTFSALLLGMASRTVSIARCAPRRRDVCPHCGYQLAPQMVCPECGPDVQVRDARSRIRRIYQPLRHWWLRLLIWVGLGLAAMLMSLYVLSETSPVPWLEPALARLDRWSLRRAITDRPTSESYQHFRWPVAKEGAIGAMVIEWKAGWGVFAQRRAGQANPGAGGGGGHVVCMHGFCERERDPTVAENWRLREERVHIQPPYAAQLHVFEFAPGRRASILVGDLSGSRGVAGVWGLPQDSYPLGVWPSGAGLEEELERTLSNTR